MGDDGMKFHVNKPMNLLALAKERCANWNDSNGRCFGWPVMYLLGGKKGVIEERDHCKLKDGEPCEYFERCVLTPMSKKEDPDAFFHYRQKLESNMPKTGIFAIENKALKTAKSRGR